MPPSKYTDSDFRKSKEYAFFKIKRILKDRDFPENVNKRLKDNAASSSAGRILVSWIQRNGMSADSYNLSLTSDIYQRNGGDPISLCVGVARPTILKTFSTVERGLIEVGLKLSPDNEREGFIQNFVKPYNQRLKEGTYERGHSKTRAN